MNLVVCWRNVVLIAVVKSWLVDRMSCLVVSVSSLLSACVAWSFEVTLTWGAKYPRFSVSCKLAVFLADAFISPKSLISKAVLPI